MEDKFLKWYKENETRFHQGHLDEKEIAYSAWLEGQKAGQHETIVNCPEPFTAEFLAYLLINALRHLNEGQRHNLALSLAVRDPLFSIDEYKKQLGN